MIVIAIGGEPATGKSTVMKKVISRLGEGSFFQYKTLKQTQYQMTHNSPDFNPIVVLGYYETGSVFGGTDRLPMNIQPIAKEWFEKMIEIGKEIKEDTVVLFEGDRLFNSSFLRLISSVVPEEKRTFITIHSEEDIKSRRHGDRDNQDEKWLKGRATKIKNIENEFSVVKLNNNKPVDADNIATFILSEIERMSK